jgi:hypothetical protein
MKEIMTNMNNKKTYSFVFKEDNRDYINNIIEHMYSLSTVHRELARFIYSWNIDAYLGYSFY